MCHRCWKRGERPPGLADKRFTFAYLFAAVQPGADRSFALVMPEATTATMRIFGEYGGRGSGVDVVGTLRSLAPCRPA